MATTEDAFLGGRLVVRQPLIGYRAATDPVFLAAAITAKPGERLLDLGCGVGTAALCALHRLPGTEAVGVELQPDYADLARENAEANGLALQVTTGDIRDLPTALAAQSFDHVLINPPFYEPDSASPPSDPGRDAAHREDAPLSAFLATGLRRLAPLGTLTIIHRAERLADILAGLTGRAGDIRIKPLASRAGRAAGRVIVAVRKGAKAPVTLHAPLVIHAGESHSTAGAGYSQAAADILRNAKPMIF